MDIDGVIERARQLAAVAGNDAAPTAALEEALVAARELSGWIEARQAHVVRRLNAATSFPEATIADAAKTSVAHATRTTERAATLAHTPALADRLDDGAITAAHVDAVTRCAKSLPEADRRHLLDRADTLADVAAAATVDEFTRRLRREVQRLRADNGERRLERQRAATRLRTWVDDEGMWNLRGRFDPLAAVPISARLTSAIDTLFAESVPDHCPTDPIEKQQFLAAHALAHLLGTSAAGTRADHHTNHHEVIAGAPGVDGPVAEFNIPVELPASVIADLAGEATTTAIVVRNGVVLHAPGELDLGRTTRLANRAQRRALRGLYATCAIPGCTTPFHHCRIHHVIWWRHDGPTDLDNLLPRLRSASRQHPPRRVDRRARLAA